MSSDYSEYIERLEEALKKIASQKYVDEIESDAVKDADFEGAYEAMIALARQALGDKHD